jgi:Tfp pilus assembly protein PilN
MKQQINLFQPTSGKFPSNKPRKLLSANMLLLGIMVLTCLGLILIYTSASQEVSTLRQKLRHFSTQNRTVEKRLADLRRTSLSKPTKSKKSDELEIEINQLSAKIETNNQLIEVLQNQSQGNMSGFSKYLEDLAYQYFENVWLTKIHLRAGGTAITLTGKTSQPELVPRLITTLSKKSAFQQVYFQQVRLERVDEKQSQSFTFVLDTASQ